MAFSKDSVAFLKKLKKNNNKEWFDQNRESYIEFIKEPSLQFASDVLMACETEKVPFTGDPKKCIFRQNRDVRFSSNKDPYKTNVGVLFTPTGEKNAFGLGYFHLEATEIFVAAGFYMPDAPLLKAFRNALKTHEAAFLKLSQALEKQSWSWDESLALKKPPSGFSDATEALQRFLKLKSFTVSKNVTVEEMTGKNFPRAVARYFKQVLPLLEFGWKHVHGARLPKV